MSPDSLVVRQLEARRRPREGGEGLHLFPDFECNNESLKLINYFDGCEPGEGLCENLVRYLAVGVTQRYEHQRKADAAAAQAGPDTSAEDMSICDTGSNTGANNVSINNDASTDLSSIIT